jgi:septal ring-binding cell division protein DamX
MPRRACNNYVKMKKKKPRKKGRRVRQLSLAKNIALLFLSLGLLAGVSFVFSYFGNRSELSLDPIQHTWKSAFSEKDKPQAVTEQPKPKTSSVAPAGLTFYETLNQKEPSGSEDSYTIQVGAFKSREKANSFARELKNKSKLSFRVDKEGKSYCVRWNTFTTQEAAARDCGKLAAKLQRACKVVKM